MLFPITIVVQVDITKNLTFFITVYVAELDACDKVHTSLLENSHTNFIDTSTDLEEFIFNGRSIWSTQLKHRCFQIVCDGHLY